MDLVKSILRKGDHVRAYGDERGAVLVGEVVSIGRVNAKVFLKVRWNPEGPWFEQTHVVPLREITMIARGDEILLDRRPKR